MRGRDGAVRPAPTVSTPLVAGLDQIQFHGLLSALLDLDFLAVVFVLREKRRVPVSTGLNLDFRFRPDLVTV